MITIDFSLAVGLCMFLAVNLVLFVWSLPKKQRDKELSLDQDFIRHCSVCTYTYINTKDGVFSVCPRCGSYNKQEIEKIV